MPFRKKKSSGGRKTFTKKVQRIISRNLETKTILVNYAGVGITDSTRTPLDQNLTGISQGDSQDTRDGNQLRMTSVSADFFITGYDSTNSIRVLLYKPKNKSDDLTGLQFNQAPDLDRFVILKDFFVTTSSAGANNKRLRFYKKFMGAGMAVQFDGPTANDVQTNMLRLYIVSDSLAVVDPSINGYVRMYFKDA